MNLLRWLSVSVLALSFVPRIALADESSISARMQQHIETDFLKPLLEHDQTISRFSRMRPAPRERRVRMPETTLARDAAGRTFLPFAIDGKFAGGDWQANDIVGCVYTEKGDLFVKIGDGYRPAAFLLGAAGEPVAGVCQAAPAPHA